MIGDSPVMGFRVLRVDQLIQGAVVLLPDAYGVVRAAEYDGLNRGFELAQDGSQLHAFYLILNSADSSHTAIVPAHTKVLVP